MRSPRPPAPAPHPHRRRTGCSCLWAASPPGWLPVGSKGHAGEVRGAVQQLEFHLRYVPVGFFFGGGGGISVFPLAARRQERGLAGQVGVGRAGRGRCLATGDPAGRGGGGAGLLREPRRHPSSPSLWKRAVPPPPPAGSAWLYEVPAEEKVSKREEEEGKKKKIPGKGFNEVRKVPQGKRGLCPGVPEVTARRSLHPCSLPRLPVPPQRLQ